MGVVQGLLSLYSQAREDLTAFTSSLNHGECIEALSKVNRTLTTADSLVEAAEGS